MTPAKTTRRGLGGWLFLAIVLLAYGLLGSFDPEAATRALDHFLHMFKQVLPALGLVFVLLYIADLVLTPNWIMQHLGPTAGWKGWLAVVTAGMLSLGPIYVWYSLLSELQKKGMRTAFGASFLYSRAIKLPLLPVMIHYFGLAYTLVLCLYLILFSFLTGILVEHLVATGYKPPRPGGST